MSLQHAAIELLDYAAKTLGGLAEGDIRPEDCRFASAKLGQAAKRLRVEPCRPEDVQETFNLMNQARPQLQALRDMRLPEHFDGWVTVACEAFNATLDLLDGLKAYQKVRLDQPEARSLKLGLRKLLPAGWWGSHV